MVVVAGPGGRAVGCPAGGPPVARDVRRWSGWRYHSHRSKLAAKTGEESYCSGAGKQWWCRWSCWLCPCGSPDGGGRRSWWFEGAGVVRKASRRPPGLLPLLFVGREKGVTEWLF